MVALSIFLKCSLTASSWWSYSSFSSYWFCCYFSL